MAMKKILVIGAGLSSSYLLKYLAGKAATGSWHLTVADSNKAAAEHKLHGAPNTAAIALDASQAEDVNRAVAASDIVISLLPPAMHVPVAQACIRNKKHLVTASYVSGEMQLLHKDALEAGVLLLNECGLDPGIDHLSAMKLIDRIRQQGGTVEVFKSFCGGLVAPEYDNNPWNYKFTWNPRNVVLAGQATARYLENDELKFIPPSRIFTQTETVHIPGLGNFESYANRDSLSYIGPYGLDKAHSVLRGTLRKEGYARAWNRLVLLGLTDDTFLIHDAGRLTYREWASGFTPGHGIENLEERVASFLGIPQSHDDFRKLEWLGIFGNERIPFKEASPAMILQQLLESKWKLGRGELDMIVMHHYVEAEIKGEKKAVRSSLVVKGEDETLTAMAKTVGLPLGIACRLILEERVSLRGVQIPVKPELYLPVLEELEEYGVLFSEQETLLA